MKIKINNPVIKLGCYTQHVYYIARNIFFMQPLFSKNIFWPLIFVLLCCMIILKLINQHNFIVWLQTGHNVYIKYTLQFITDTVTFISLGVPLIYSIYQEKLKKNKMGRYFFIYVGLSVATAGLISFLLKHTLLQPRPFQMDPRILKWSGGVGLSFPSGHTIEAFSAAAAMAIVLPQRSFVLLIFSWAFLVGFSRIYLGVHYPFDVLGGITLGISTSYFLYLVFKKKNILFLKEKRGISKSGIEH